MKDEKLSSAFHRLAVLHQSVHGTGDVLLAGDELKRMLVRCEQSAFLRGMTATLEEITPHLKTSEALDAARAILSRVRKKLEELRTGSKK